MTLSLARRAERFPDRTAVVDISEERLYAPAGTIDERSVSYGGLERVTAATARRLAALGIEAGDTVCLLTRNRVASLATVFACRRLGATVAPISHLLTPVTVKRPFELLEPDLVVFERAQSDLARAIPFDRTVTLAGLAATDTDDDLDSGRPDAAGPLLALHGDGGRPVVTFTESTLEWNCISAIVAWGLVRDDVAPLLAPLSSPHGLVRVALPLLYVGGELLLDRAFDPGDAVTAVRKREATVLSGPARSLADLTAESGFEGALESVTRVVCEGEIPDAVRDVFEAGTPVVRTFGRLECPTAFSGSLETEADVGVGRPMPDCRARLVADGRELEGKGDGRLELSGRVVADGYATLAGRDDGATSPGGEETGEVSKGAFVDGRFDTGERFQRDTAGNYHPC